MNVTTLAFAKISFKALAIINNSITISEINAQEVLVRYKYNVKNTELVTKMSVLYLTCNKFDLVN